MVEGEGRWKVVVNIHFDFFFESFFGDIFLVFVFIGFIWVFRKGGFRIYRKI